MSYCGRCKFRSKRRLKARSPVQAACIGTEVRTFLVLSLALCRSFSFLRIRCALFAFSTTQGLCQPVKNVSFRHKLHLQGIFSRTLMLRFPVVDASSFSSACTFLTSTTEGEHEF